MLALSQTSGSQEKAFHLSTVHFTNETLLKHNRSKINALEDTSDKQHMDTSAFENGRRRAESSVKS